MAKRGPKHMDESWVVKANRERDRQEQIKARERLDALAVEWVVAQVKSEVKPTPDCF